jgi:hypothetical protein
MSGQGLDRFKRWSEIYVKQVEGLRDAYRDDEFRDLVDRALKEGKKDRALSVIIKELMRAWMRDRQRQPKENDAQDFFHAVVPVHYCGAVFLDGDWEERVRQVRIRIEKSGVPLTLAKVFSKKADGVERFLGMLEAA